MSQSIIDLRVLVGSALTVLALGACNASDAGPDTAAPPAATPATAGTPSTSDDPVATAAAPSPSAPVNPMTRQMVSMAAKLFAMEKACLPARAADQEEARATNRKALASTGTTMSKADMDALFDAEYAKAQHKLQALSDAERARSCAELEAAAKAAAAGIGQ